MTSGSNNHSGFGVRARTRIPGAIGSWVVMLALATPVHGQVRFSENFDSVGADGGNGPANLVAAGWVFRNQSDPGLAPSWYQSPSSITPLWPAFEGPPTGYIVTQQRAVVEDEGEGSVWMILPSVPGQQAGDVINFYLRAQPNFADVLEVRYSPSGGSGTGSGPQDVGDFTTLLYSSDGRTSEGGWLSDRWYFVELTLPGSGRIAFRYVSPYAHPLGSGSIWSIDLLTIAGSSNEPPYPKSGETVHWTMAMSPVQIPDDREIVAGGTVIVDPGVTIAFASDADLTVSGTLLVQGTAAEPVVLAGDSTNMILGLGTKRFDFCEFEIDVVNSSTFRDCTFNATSRIGWVGATVVNFPTFYDLERCTFNGGTLRTAGQTRLKDVQIIGADAFMHGYYFVDNVQVEGGRLVLSAGKATQRVFIDNVSVTNNPTGPGLELGFREFLLGPNNVIQGNEVPIDMELVHAGILPGSVVPTTGNTFNYVRDAGQNGGHSAARWAKIDVPYVVEISAHHNNWKLDAGATVLFKPGVSVILDASALELRGTPDEPIYFGPYDPAQGWGGIAGIARADNVIIEGAAIASVAGSVAWFNECVIRDGLEGVVVADFRELIARKTQFINNAVGLRTLALQGDALLDWPTMPNSFAGNGVGIQHESIVSVAAGHVWWGDPSGPQHPTNPGGSGDSVTGNADDVAVQPFLTASPDYSNHLPVVRLQPVSPWLFADTKIILIWEASDDDTIVSQRIEYSEGAALPGTLVTIADGLDPDVRTFEWTLPLPTSPVGNPVHIRVVATDSLGQEGYDELLVHVPQHVLGTTQLTFTADLTGPFEIDERLDICYQVDNASAEPDIGMYMLDADRRVDYFGGLVNRCTVIPTQMPPFSTDLARVALLRGGVTGNSDWYFSDYFEIRPNTGMGDAPPAITLLTPQAGDSYVGGTVVPIAWSASDDQGIRAFDIQASYDGGRFWNVVVQDLPPTATSYDWHLPASTGIPDVRVRVIVHDTRFQNSSDGTERVFSILPGAGVPGDVDGDGDVDLIDLSLLLDAFGTCSGDTGFEPAADFDGSGCVDLVDLSMLLGAFGT